jgi:hypothetical protein
MTNGWRSISARLLFEEHDVHRGLRNRALGVFYDRRFHDLNRPRVGAATKLFLCFAKEFVMRLSDGLVVCFVLSALAGLAGCEGPQRKPDGSAAAVHNHPTKGPHGGSLIELGNEEYHVEMLHDDASGTVTFYVLDGSAKKFVPIAATEVTVNLKHDGKPEQFKIPAKADTGDPAGQSSRFVSTDKELAEDLDKEGADAELVLTIGSTPFRGKIAHQHDHK